MIPLVLPLTSADTRPVGTVGLELHAGMSLVSIDVPSLPVFPALTLGLAVERGVLDRVDMGVRYTTWLGFDHRLGPELQLTLLRERDFALGLRTHPWLRVAGTAQGPLSYGGDLSTASALVSTLRTGKLALTAEAGATVQWALFERLDRVSYVDGRPWLATADLVAELAWADRQAQALALRLELGIPRAPDDPLSLWGVRPRLLIAGHFGLPTK